MTHQQVYDLLFEYAKKYTEDGSEETLKSVRKYAGICSKYFNDALKNFNKNLKVNCECWEIPSFTTFKNLFPVIKDKTNIEFTDSHSIRHIPLHRLSPEYITTWKRQKLNWLIESTKNTITTSLKEVEELKNLLITLENNLKNI